MIVELVGLPGVGKSTLAKTLCNHSQKIYLAKTPYFRHAADIPFFVGNSLRLLPRFLRILMSKDGGKLSLRDIALMVILNGWRKVLNRQVAANKIVLLLDEGPICYLTRLYAWGSDGTRSKEAAAWWQTMFREWADCLDLIIQMDASDEILIERIRSRDMWQEVKTMTEEQAMNYIENLRATQNQVLFEITSQDEPPNCVCIDTQINSPEETCLQVAGRFPL